MAEEQKVYYNKSYARLLIVLGLLFTAIFVLGYFIANMAETLLYCIMSSVMIIVGFSIQSIPYVYYDEQTIILFNFFGREREQHEFDNKSAITVKNNQLYLNDRKIKANDWFLNKGEWNRMLQFYSADQDKLIAELQDS